MKTGNQDKAGKKYWDKTERNQAIEMLAFDPHGTTVRDFGKRIWHQLLKDAVQPQSTGRRKFLELGCGGSALLPYFAREFDFEVFGMDYSERGCELASELCTRNGVTANIICSDFFRAPEAWFNAFDVVASFGVLEHFSDTPSTVSAFSKFVKPGGTMITTIPNMNGAPGFVQQLLARDVFDKHVPITLEELRSAHEKAGISISQCKYFLFTNFGVVNPGPRPPIYKKLSHSLLKMGTGLSWAVESAIGPLPPNRWTSPYLVAVGKKLVN